MTDAARWAELGHAFERLRQLPRPDRVVELDVIAQTDAALHDELEQLLDHHDQEAPLDAPVTPAQVRAAAVGRRCALPRALPEVIGRYRILECIGSGGMGAVYRAEQDQPRRTVAVKVVRAAVVSDDVRRRFEFEVAALGRLQHPGIAQVIEAGLFGEADTAVPFFAMEFVEGRALDAYLAAEQPAFDERLRLFAAICDAVHHAHQKGIIHRDLKPANVLVTADGRPKVVDFGVARATDSDRHLTLNTAPGQLVGTLTYMSPEQVGAAPERLDTRSDVYALGVILYEMLAGRLPYELAGTTMAEAMRIIGEVPPAPLTRVDGRFRGDVGTIVDMALRKDPDARYASASDLGNDVRRYLRREPIIARPATLVYQLGMFARRHRAFVASAVAITVVLLAAVIIIVAQSAATRREARTRREVAAFLGEMLI